MPDIKLYAIGKGSHPVLNQLRRGRNLSPQAFWRRRFMRRKRARVRVSPLGIVVDMAIWWCGFLACLAVIVATGWFMTWPH